MDALAVAPPCGPGGRRLRPRGSHRRSARVPERAALPAARRGPAHAGYAPAGSDPVRAVVVAEYYPRAGDPVLGVLGPPPGDRRPRRRAPTCGCWRCTARSRRWQRCAGPRWDGRSPAPCASRGDAPWTASRSRYVRYLSPPRPLAYGGWGAWAAPALGRALRSLRESFPFDLVHAHYAVPAGDAVRRIAPGVPVRGLGSRWRRAGHRGPRAPGTPSSRPARLSPPPAWCWPTAPTPRAAAAQHGARRSRVVHLGTDVPATPVRRGTDRRSCRRPSGGRASATRTWCERCRTWASALTTLRYVVVGDGPEREPLRALATQLGVGDRVQLRGQLAPAAALATARAAALFVLPSVDEAFGVAYIEAMAAGVPAIGAPRRGRARGDRRRRRRDRAGGAPRPAGARGAYRRTCWTDSPGTQALGLRARDTVARAISPGSSAGRRRLPPIGPRCDDRSRSCLSPTTRRLRGWGPSRRWLSARGWRWRCSAGAWPRRRLRRRAGLPPPPRRPAAGLLGWRPAGGTAPSWPAPTDAWPCRRRTPGHGGRESRSCCGPPCGLSPVAPPGWRVTAVAVDLRARRRGGHLWPARVRLRARPRGA